VSKLGGTFHFWVNYPFKYTTMLVICGAKCPVCANVYANPLIHSCRHLCFKVHSYKHTNKEQVELVQSTDCCTDLFAMLTLT